MITLEISHRPDLILMAIGLMGSPDGIDGVLEIGSRYNIPVLFITAYYGEARMAVSSSHLWRSSSRR
ncbi:MAG: hypothetical protein LUP97_08320 [Methanoregula sp.]|nr:hypothetical protein [Methanoregula sp.]